MARRALWRASPDDPRTPLGWLWGDLDYVSWAAYKIVGRGMLILAAYLLLHGGACAALALALVVALTTLPHARLRRAKVGSLLTLPPPVTPFPVTIETFHKGVLLGRDRGVASFVDGWLQVEGKRTDFGLRGADAKATKEVTGAWRLDLEERGMVRLWPDDQLTTEKVRERDLRARFGRAVAAWQAEGTTDEGTVLPPLEAHASGWARVWGDLFLVGLNVALTFLAFAKLGSFWGLATIVFLPSPSVYDLFKASRRLRQSGLDLREGRVLP